MSPGLAARLRGYVSPARANVGPHGLFRYPAKYLPQIARALLLETSGAVLDPFSGSGTTLVEAAALGRASAGLDLNPLAVLLGAAKTTPLDPAAVRASGERALRRARELDPAEVPIPEFPNRDYWFPEASLVPLARLRTAVSAEPDPDLARILLVTLLSIVKACSNASTYHYKLTRSREPAPVGGEEVAALYARRLAKAAERVRPAGPSGPVLPILGDARRIPFPDGAFEAVVTHPPYSISFDFVRSFKIYLWWLDPGGDTVALDRGMVGNQRRASGEPPLVGVSAIDERTRQVAARDLRDGLAVGWFFRDMDRVVRECRRVLAPGGRLALYVGDSRARWIPLGVPGALVALAERAGFRALARVPREVPRRASSTIRQIHVEEALLFERG